MPRPLPKIRRFISLVSVLSLLGLQFAAAQATEALPPHVIEVMPLPGVEIGTHEPLIIVFNQPMQPTSVSVQFQPQLQGEVRWIDERTLSFLPENGTWELNRLYTVIVEGAAENGLPLPTPYAFEVQTKRGLAVAVVSPESGANGVNAEGTQITVTFDRPVVPLTSTGDQRHLPTPIQIAPHVAGTGTWVNTSVYIFAPSAHLRGNTIYTVTIPAGLTAVDGTAVTETIVSTFRTLAPQAWTIRATSTWGEYQNVLLDSAFEVAFSQPMDRVSTEAAFRLESYDLCCDFYPGNIIPGTFEWNEPGTQLTFAPDEPLQSHRGYVVTIETSAHSAEDAATLSSSAVAHFATVGLPAVRETTPRGGAIVRPSRSRVVFRFNTPMNTDSYEGHYTISPEPEGEVIPYVLEDGSLALEFDQELDQTYTITLLPGIEDLYGNAMTTKYDLVFFVQADDVRTSVQPQLKGDFIVVGTYQEAPMLPVRITGSPTITLDIYSLDMETLDAAYRWRSDDPYYYEGTSVAGNRVGRLYYAMQQGRLDAIPWVRPENHLSTWTSSYAVGDADREGEEILIPLAGADGELLPAGLYGIEITSPGALGWNAQSKTGFVLAISDVSLTVKSAPGEALVWVTDFASSQPVEGALLQVFREGEVIAGGETNADGVFRLPEAALDVNTSVFIQSEGENRYGAWNSTVSRQGEATSSSLYTDRPIYRPGETVYFRGIIRDRNDMDYTVPEFTEVYASVAMPYSGYSDPPTPFYQSELEITAFGTFSGSFVLPDDLQLGSYGIRVSSCPPDSQTCGSPRYGANISFEVAEFRVPEFEVSVTAQQPEVIAGEPVNAQVAAAYYFGGAVGNADVGWRIYGNGYADFFSYRGGERGFRFYDEESYGRIDAANEFPVSTDANGNYLISDTLTLTSSRPVNVRIEATVTDESGQAISARTRLLVHPANVYVGLRSSATFGAVDQMFNVDILTVTPDSEARPGQVVDLEVVEVRWVRHTIAFGRYEWRTEIIPVGTAQVITDSEGKTSYAFTPPNAGIFRIRAVISDEQGRQGSSAIRVYARESGETRSRVWWDPYLYDHGMCGWSAEVQLLRLMPDSDSYRPGDSAEIFIPNPYSSPVTALVTIERAGVLSYEVLTIEGEALTYSLPITDEHAPTIYFGVVLMRGISDENPDPQYIRGSLQLNVEPVNRRLTISVTPASETVQPGDLLSFDVYVTDSRGNPVQAEVGLALTDEASLALRPPNSGTLERQFYGQQRLSVMTSASNRALMTMPDNTSSGGCGGGGGGDVPLGFIREDFIYTPLWAPHVITDENGHATVSLEMPDNLTRWRLDARAVTTDTRVGQAQVNVTSTLPLLVRPVAPRFFVAGDRLPLAAIVNNNTDERQIVEVTLEAEGVTLESSAEPQTVLLEPGSRQRVEWQVVVQEVAGVDITVYAVSESGLQDAAKPALRTGPDDTIPVLRYIAPDTMSTGGVLLEADSRMKGISLPPRFANASGMLTVTLNPSIAASTIESLDYLRSYPHLCIEQIVSRFYPNAVTYNALRSLGVEDETLEENLTTTLEQGLTLLEAAQNHDGGRGWFGGMESNPYVTAYALLGLHEAERAGFDIDDKLIEDALTYLQGQIISPEINTPGWELNRQAFLLYVLALYCDTEIEQLAILNEQRLEMSFGARAYLLMAYHHIAPNAEAISALKSDFESSALQSATGAHWEEVEPDWQNWGSDTRTTALVLASLIQVQPDHPLLPNVVRWLMITRRGDHWQTTQETAWAVVALSDWMLYTRELEGTYAYTAQLNGVLQMAGSVIPETVQESTTLQVEVGDLWREEVNRLSIARGEGEGALYYTALLNLQLPVAEVEAINRGIGIERQYSIGTSRDSVQQAQVGDVITVRLSLYLPQDVYYFTLEDILPAGTEVLGTSLLTTQQTATNPTLERLSRDDPYWYWHWWYFDRTELHDQGATLYADYLPRGSYVFSYQVRATSPGEFQVLPAQGYTFYQPDVFGRTDGTTFRIVG